MNWAAVIFGAVMILCAADSPDRYGPPAGLALPLMVVGTVVLLLGLLLEAMKRGRS